MSETAVTLPEHAAPATIAATTVGELPPDLLADAGFELRYEDGAKIGEGGMGFVRACLDRRIGREVAMKVVRPGDGSRGDLKARFLREACVQGQLEHPAIVPVYDLGRDPEGTLYFTMKRVRGSTFERIVDALRAGDADAMRLYSRHKLLSAFVAVCHAVDFAHARGVVHRDLKPANVMLGDYGEVYVLDWGLAKVVGAPEPRLPSDAPAIASGSDPGAKTVHGATMGTPGYMAPEQLRGETVDVRADVYALGAILFELLALETLHTQATADLANASTLRGADARPSRRAPERDLPPELDDVCVAATATDAELRTPTVRAIIDAVERYLEGDRDLARRKTLAQEHVRAASAHARTALGPGPDAARARSLALREIGRAVALDPTDREAVSTLMHLMTEAPAEMPIEASENMRIETRRGLRFAARGAAISYLSWFAYLPFMLWAGVKSWLAWGIASAAWAIGAWAAYKVSRKPPHSGSRPFLLTAAGVVAILGTSTLWGPYILVPTLAAVGSMLMHMSPDRRGRIAIVLANCGAIAVPAALQAFGVIPPSYVFGQDSITVLPVMIHFSPLATHAFLATGSITLVVTASMMVARIRDTLTTLEERLYIHTWQLRQLVPDQARPASAHPQMKAVESTTRLPTSDRPSDI